MKHRKKPSERRRKKRRRTERDPFAPDPARRFRPWEPIKQQLFEVEPPSPADLPVEQRLDVLRRIGQEAERRFQIRYPAIRNWFVEYDAPYPLAFCACYILSHPEGVDVEAEGRLEFLPHYLEILQAFALTAPRSFSPKPLMAETSKLKNDLREAGELMKLRLFNPPDAVESRQDLKAHYLRTEMMAHTTAVRNWGYHHQMRRITRNLVGLVAGEFRALHGVDPVRVSGMLFGLGELSTERLNAHRDRVRSFMRTSSHRNLAAAYAEAFPETTPMTAEQADRLWELCREDIWEFRAWLAAHSDLRLYEVFAFTLDDAVRLYGDATDRDALRLLLDRLCIEFRELAEHNPEHFILTNPVHARPFIRLGPDQYFTGVHGVIPHIALNVLEGLLAGDEGLRKRYSARRAEYLEREVEGIFRDGFPSAGVLANVRWTDPGSGSLRETDLLVVVDEFALVVECKSGIVTPPARRGAPDRFYRTLRELIEEPSVQARQLSRFLQSLDSPLLLANDRGASLTVDPARVKYYVPIAITFEHLGAISSNMKKLVDTGIATLSREEFAACLSLTDLECVFDMLEGEAEKVHYFARRREFERHVDYQGDEEDLLAFYLENGFNIGSSEYDGKIAFMLLGKAKELNPYFIRSGEGQPVPKPRPARTQWWRDLLHRLQDRRPPGWLVASYCLLNLSESDQKTLERDMLKLARLVREGRAPKRHNWVACMSGPPERRFFVAAYPYSVQEKADRDAMLMTIISSDEASTARGAVVIGLDVTKMHYPYSVFAGRLESNLFA